MTRTKVWSYDFERANELERERVRVFPAVPAEKLYDALRKHLWGDCVHVILRELGIDCELAEDEMPLIEREIEIGKERSP
jgi:hypothetical protein